MINEFLNRNNNLDSLIILIIGIIIPFVSKLIFSIVNKAVRKLSHFIISKYREFKRRMSGSYTLYEIKRIQQKPEKNRNRKEKAALEEYEKTMSKISDSIKVLSTNMQVINSKLTDVFKE